MSFDVFFVIAVRRQRACGYFPFGQNEDIELLFSARAEFNSGNLNGFVDGGIRTGGFEIVHYKSSVFVCIDQRIKSVAVKIGIVAHKIAQRHARRAVTFDRGDKVGLYGFYKSATNSVERADVRRVDDKPHKRRKIFDYRSFVKPVIGVGGEKRNSFGFRQRRIKARKAFIQIGSIAV